MYFTCDPVQQWSFQYESQGITHISRWSGAGEGRNLGVCLHLIRRKARPQLSQVLAESSQAPQGCWLFHYVQLLSCQCDSPRTRGTLSIQDLSKAMILTKAKEDRGCLNQLNIFWQGQNRSSGKKKKNQAPTTSATGCSPDMHASFLHFN